MQGLCDFYHTVEFLRGRLSEELILLLPVAIPLQRSCDMMKSSVVKRSIVISGHKTSVSLEDTFWEALKEIARQRDASVPGLVSSIELEREQYSNLSSAIRVFVLDWYRHQHDVAGTNAFSVKAPAPSAHLAS